MPSRPLATASGSYSGGWHGRVLRVLSTAPLRTETLALCIHRHRGARTARVCAAKMLAEIEAGR